MFEVVNVSISIWRVGVGVLCGIERASRGSDA